MSSKEIAILYIATGRYIAFWKDFYESCEEFFLNGYIKNYYIFTDNVDFIYANNCNVHKVYQEKLGWPYDTLMRFEMFLKIKDKLKENDYIYFFNANMRFVDFIYEEILPIEQKDGLVVGQHPGYFNELKKKFPYDRNLKSSAYIPYDHGRYYVQGCLFGGKTAEYIKLCEICNNNINKDLENNVMALWHDESHLNRYIIGKDVLFLPPNYLYPEGWNLKKHKENIKIIQTDKRNPEYGGIDWLRGLSESRTESSQYSNKELIKSKNIIFVSHEIDIRSGGPSGYVANLKDGLSAINNGDIAIVCLDYDKYKIINLLRRLSLFNRIFGLIYKLFIKIIKLTFSTSVDIENRLHPFFVKQLNKYDFLTITCHQTKDVLPIKNYLIKRKLKALILLMSHSPEPRAEEIKRFYELQCNRGVDKLYKRWQVVDRVAFDVADILVFPSKESMDPYLFSLDYFEKLSSKKNIKFIPTGCVGLVSEHKKEEIREKYSIQTPYIVSYIGRHSVIKGYDKLKEIAKNILDKRDDITFLIAGQMSNEIAPLDNSRWIEVGWQNPADIFLISDLFLLPNKQTYFDLILLEALSMGVPVLASNTGGNKTVFSQTNSILIYDTVNEAVHRVEDFLSLPQEARKAFGDSGLNAYKMNYTQTKFAQNYIGIINEIIE